MQNIQFNQILNNVKVYEAGKPIELVVREFGIKPKDIIKLASNENPYGCSKKVTQKIKELSSEVYRYPDDSMYELKGALANRFNINSNNIIIGAGSDQVIEFSIRAKCDNNSKILIAGITFAMYEIYAAQIGAKVIKTSSLEHDLDEFKYLYKKENPDMIFLCLPNNPLGECLNSSEVYQFLDEIDEDCLVVLDGAYQEYAAYKDNDKKLDIKKIINYPNVLYLGTFSKAFGLGGLRVGYGIANNHIIKTLHKLRPPFNITTLSLAAAIEALKDIEFVNKSIENNFIQMDRYIKFAKKHNFKYINSYTNFITIFLENDSKQLSQNLLQNGVIIRDMSSYGFNAIRVTIGSKEQNDRFFEVFEKVYE
jgi:histidinol-phosphate aminotransferase